jgi:hypothetical protein
MANNLRPEVEKRLRALKMLKAQGVSEGDPVARAAIDQLIGEGAHALYRDFNALEQFMGEVRNLGGQFARSADHIRNLQMKSRVGANKATNAKKFAERHLSDPIATSGLMNRLVESGMYSKIQSGSVEIEDLKTHPELFRDLSYASSARKPFLGTPAIRSFESKFRAQVQSAASERIRQHRYEIKTSDLGSDNIQDVFKTGVSENARAMRAAYEDFGVIGKFLTPAESEKHKQMMSNLEERRRVALYKTLSKSAASSLGRNVPEEERLENAKTIKDFISNPLNTLSDPTVAAAFKKKFGGRADKILTTSPASPVQQEVQGWMSQFIKAKSDVSRDAEGKVRVMPLVEQKQNVQSFAEGLKKELDKRTEGGTKSPADKQTLDLAKLLEKANTYLDRIDKGIGKQSEQSDKRAKDYQRRQAALDRELDRKYPFLSKMPLLRAGGGGGEPPEKTEAEIARDARNLRGKKLSLASTAVTAGLPALAGVASDYYGTMAKSPLAVISAQQEIGTIDQNRLMGALSMSAYNLVEHGGTALFPGLRNTFAGGRRQAELSQGMAAQAVEYEKTKDIYDMVKGVLSSGFAGGGALSAIAAIGGAAALPVMALGGLGFAAAGAYSFMGSKYAQRKGYVPFEVGDLLQQQREAEYALMAQRTAETLRAQEMGRNQLRVRATESFMELSANNLINARVAGAGRAFDLVEFVQKGNIDYPAVTQERWRKNRDKYGPLPSEELMRKKASEEYGGYLDELTKTSEELDRLKAPRSKAEKKREDAARYFGWSGMISSLFGGPTNDEERIKELESKKAQQQQQYASSVKFADLNLLIQEGVQRDQAEAEVMQEELVNASKRINAVDWMRMGFSPEEYASTHARIVAAAGRNMEGGAAGRDKATSITSRLLAMSLAGTGSVEQLVGNLGSISAVTGQTDVQAKKSLEDMMTEAIKRGFDNSRTAQAMVQMSTDISSKIGIRDPFTVQRILAQGGMGMGGSEADFYAFAKGSAQIGDIYKNPAIQGLSLINYKMTGGLAGKYSNLVWQASQDPLGAFSTASIASELEGLDPNKADDRVKADAILNKLPPSMQGVVSSHWRNKELGILKGNLLNPLEVMKALARNFGQGSIGERNASFDKNVEILKAYAKTGGPKTDAVREAFSDLTERFTRISGGSSEAYQALTSMAFTDPSLAGLSSEDRAEYEKRIKQGFGQGDRFSMFSRSRKAMDMMLTGMFTQSFDKPAIEAVARNASGKTIDSLSLEQLTAGTLYRGYVTKNIMENFRGKEKITEADFKEALKRVMDPKYKSGVVPSDEVKTVMGSLAQTGGMNAIQESIMAAQTYGRGQDVYITNASEVGLSVASAMAGYNPNKPRIPNIGKNGVVGEVP